MKRTTHIPRRIDARGFTVLELMVVVALVALIMGIAAPSFADFMRNSRMTSAANDLLTAMYTARSEAVKQRVQTVMCFTADSNEDTPDCDGDGTQGWVVFVDANNSGVPDAGETVSLRHGPLHDSIDLTASPEGNDGYVAYAGSGFSRTTALGAPLTGIVLCNERGNEPVGDSDNSYARAVVVSDLGRPGVTRLVDTIDDLGGC